jgi:peroxiredoxin
MPLPASPATPLKSLVLLATLLVARPSQASVGFAVGDTLPPIIAADQDGQPYALASLHGKWVFLDFCATWCPPCNAMGEEAQAVYDTFGDGSLLSFEYVSALIQGPAAAASTQADAEAWAAAHVLSRPVLHDGGVAAASPQFDFVHAGFTVVPTGLILDPDGVVRDVTVGYQSPAQLVGRLSQLAGLPEPPPSPPPPVLPKCPSLAGASLAVTIGGITDTSPVTETGSALLRYGSWGGAFGEAELGVIESDPMDIDQEAL